MIELTPEFALTIADGISQKATEAVTGCAKGGQSPYTLKEIDEAAEAMGFEFGKITGAAVAALQAGYVEGYEAYMKEHGLDDEGRKQKGGVELSIKRDTQIWGKATHRVIA